MKWQGARYAAGANLILIMNDAISFYEFRADIIISFLSMYFKSKVIVLFI
jgi:hypothetical protein